MRTKLFFTAILIGFMATCLSFGQTRFHDRQYDDGVRSIMYRPLITENFSNDQYFSVYKESQDMFAVVLYDNMMNVITTRKYRIYTDNGVLFRILDPQDLKWDPERNCYVMVSNGSITGVNACQTIINTFDWNGDLLNTYLPEPEPGYAAKHIRLDIVQDQWFVTHNNRIFRFDPNSGTIPWSYIFLNPNGEPDIPFLGGITHDDNNNIYCTGIVLDNNASIFLAKFDFNGTPIERVYFPNTFGALYGETPMVITFNNPAQRVIIGYTSRLNQTGYSMFWLGSFDANALGNNFGRGYIANSGGLRFERINDIYLREGDDRLYVNGYLADTTYRPNLGIIGRGSFQMELNANDLLPNWTRKYMGQVNGAMGYGNIQLAQLFYYNALGIVTNYGRIQLAPNNSTQFLYATDVDYTVQPCEEFLFELYLKDIQYERQEIEIEPRNYLVNRFRTNQVIENRLRIYDKCPENFISFSKESFEDVASEFGFTSNNYTIELSNAPANASFTISSMQGATVASGNLTPAIDISNLASGMYTLVVFKEDGSVFVQKFTVLR